MTKKCGGIKGIREDARIRRIQISGALRRLDRLGKELEEAKKALAAMESTK